MKIIGGSLGTSGTAELVRTNHNLVLQVKAGGANRQYYSHDYDSMNCSIQTSKEFGALGFLLAAIIFSCLGFFFFGIIGALVGFTLALVGSFRSKEQHVAELVMKDKTRILISGKQRDFSQLSGWTLLSKELP